MGDPISLDRPWSPRVFSGDDLTQGLRPLKLRFLESAYRTLAKDRRILLARRVSLRVALF